MILPYIYISYIYISHIYLLYQIYFACQAHGDEPPPTGLIAKAETWATDQAAGRGFFVISMGISWGHLTDFMLSFFS